MGADDGLVTRLYGICIIVFDSGLRTAAFVELYNDYIMKITNTERMNQLASSIDVAVDVILTNLDNQEVLNRKVSRIKDITIKDMLTLIKDCCRLIADADPHYFADLDIGYTEDNFPVEH